MQIKDFLYSGITPEFLCCENAAELRKTLPKSQREQNTKIYTINTSTGDLNTDVLVAYPTGFDYTNTVILACMVTRILVDADRVSVKLTEEGIVINASNQNYIHALCSVVIMKY